MNHHDADFSLDELSNKFHIREFYPARLFQNAFGMSPIRYHHLTHLEKAKQLLRFTELPIQQIAYQLGFYSIHDFSRVFKKQEGVAPSHSRRAY